MALPFPEITGDPVRDLPATREVLRANDRKKQTTLAGEGEWRKGKYKVKERTNGKERKKREMEDKTKEKRKIYRGGLNKTRENLSEENRKWERGPVYMVGEP